ncbi:MAG: hypothetical protein AAGU11_07530 [Syntrophobacteraceae bacterium]
MRNLLIGFCALLLSASLFPQVVSAQTRQDALRALQALQSRCESGLNYDMFETALDEAQTGLSRFFDFQESEKNPEFTEKAERALVAYQTAFILWKGKVTYRQDFISYGHPTAKMLVDVYPEVADQFDSTGQARVSDLVKFFWDKADERIAEAKKLVSAKSKR